MKKRQIISIVIFILIILILALIVNTSQSKVCIENKKCFSVTLAKTQEEKRIGLGQTNVLPRDEGMLFVFDTPERVGFWMKGMNFPLDIIWIDENLKIVGVEGNLIPCTENCKIYYSPEKIKYVLEINSNLFEENNLSIGDKINL